MLGGIISHVYLHMIAALVGLDTNYEIIFFWEGVGNVNSNRFRKYLQKYPSSAILSMLTYK